MKGKSMADNTQETSLYTTADLGTAVYLLTIGHELVKTSLHSPTRLLFHFRRNEDIELQVGRYLSGAGVAPARKLFECYRSLRALAFTQTGNLRR